MEQSYRRLMAEVVSVTEHEHAAYTIEIKVKRFFFEQPDSLTIDPRCTFYKDNEVPKAINVVKPGDAIEAAYLVDNNIKVAFNIAVQKRP